MICYICREEETLENEPAQSKILLQCQGHAVHAMCVMTWHVKAARNSADSRHKCCVCLNPYDDESISMIDKIKMFFLGKAKESICSDMVDGIRALSNAPLVLDYDELIQLIELALVKGNYTVLAEIKRVGPSVTSFLTRLHVFDRLTRGGDFKTWFCQEIKEGRIQEFNTLRVQGTALFLVNLMLYLTEIQAYDDCLLLLLRFFDQFTLKDKIRFGRFLIRESILKNFSIPNDEILAVLRNNHLYDPKWFDHDLFVVLLLVDHFWDQRDLILKKILLDSFLKCGDTRYFHFADCGFLPYGKNDYMTYAVKYLVMERDPSRTTMLVNILVQNNEVNLTWLDLADMVYFSQLTKETLNMLAEAFKGGFFFRMLLILLCLFQVPRIHRFSKSLFSDYA